MTHPPSPATQVYFVGAGPGAPGLLTLRGAQCLARADVVLYDYLVNPRILDHASPAAERICLGRHGHSRIWTQDEINAALVARARAGQCVVRLKGGDPSIFGRAGEELEALAAAGVTYEVVPGVTAALAAAACAGIPVTHRELASAVAFITGQQCAGGDTSPVDYASLARFPGTLVFYMGVTTARQWTAALLAAGKPGDTPAAVVRRASLPDQATHYCTLAEVAARLAPAARLRPPVLVLVGEVAALGPRLTWFQRRPLFGLSVLVARAEEQAAGLADLLEELGAETLLQPALRITAPDDWAPVDDALRRLSQFHWVAFSSANGVRWLLRRLGELGRDARAFGATRLAAIGPGTARALAEHRLLADLQPEPFRAEALAAALAAAGEEQRVLLVRASRGREVLAETLRAAGHQVEQVVAYASRDVERPHPEIAARMERGEIDWVAVTSSAMAHGLVRLFGPALAKARLASISPITSAALRELGFEPAAEAREFTMPGVTAAIVEATRGDVD